MNNKIRGSEKMMFTCDKNGKRSLADFENVEEALQASGGMYSIFEVWPINGQPWPDFFKYQEFKDVAIAENVGEVMRQKVQF